MGTIAGFEDVVAFQTAYVNELIDSTDYPKIDTEHTTKLFIAWKNDKRESIMTFRDKQHLSAKSGTVGAEPKTTWLQQFDTSKEGFLLNNAKL